MIKSYKVCVDKGTYDAISLCKDETHEKRRRYRANVIQMLQSHGLFFITSCNWTEEELTGFFTQENQLRIKQILPTPKFSFGGKTGNNVTSIVFEKTE